MTRIDHGTCGHCGRPVLGGWSGTGTMLSVQVTVDAAPLPSPEAELAWLAVPGRRTWTLHPVAGQLHPRSPRKVPLTPRRDPPPEAGPPGKCIPPPLEETRA